MALYAHTGVHNITDVLSVRGLPGRTWREYTLISYPDNQQTNYIR